jgi:hypothetical protein
MKINVGQRHGISVLADNYDNVGVQYLEITGMETIPDYFECTGTNTPWPGCTGLHTGTGVGVAEAAAYAATCTGGAGVPYVGCTSAGNWSYGSIYAINMGWSNTAEVAHNYFHDNWGQSDIYASAYTCSQYGDIKIHHNTMETGTENYLSTICGVDFYNNSCDVTNARLPYDIIHAYSNDGTGLRIQYLRYFNNFFKSIDQMNFFENHWADGSKTQHIRIFNNVYTTPTAGTGKPIILENNESASGVDDVIIANNTFVNTSYTLRYTGNVSSKPTYTNFKFVNNIDSNTLYGVTADNDDTTHANDAAAVIDYNTVYRSGGGITLTWQGGTPGIYYAYTSFTGQWLTDHSTLSHNLMSDPGFTSSSDFHLTSGSASKAAGYDASAYTNMDSISWWPKDKDGVTRTGWSIGAYECGAGGGSTGSSLSGGSCRGCTIH